MALVKVDTHNQGGYLHDAPTAHQEYQSMIKVLRECPVVHALTVTPVIYEELITDFWVHARCVKESLTLESTVQGTKIVISEAIIREVLKITDQDDYPSEFSVKDIKQVLVYMYYEGSFPPINKKQLSPFWRFLFHTWFHCLCGRRGGTDEISLPHAHGLIALAMSWNFNYSKYIFQELKNNCLSKSKFMLFPRFLQAILNDKYPNFVKTGNTIDLKSVGPKTFENMKKQYKEDGKKPNYKGIRPFVKYGRYADAPAAQAEGAQVQEAQVQEAPIQDAQIHPAFHEQPA